MSSRTRLVAISFFLSALLLGGCVSEPVKPSAGTLANIKSIYIVPMKSPPLTGTFAGSPDFDRLAKSTDKWHLTAELAMEAARVLNNSGRVATISPELRAVPGVQESGRTFSMENWMGPLREWYNDASPATLYASRPKEVGPVVEIGISNFEVVAEMLSLQVHMKLIDVPSGNLLGRSRAYSTSPAASGYIPPPPAGSPAAQGVASILSIIVAGAEAPPSNERSLAPLAETFADDAKNFKEKARSIGNPLVLKCLRELGLVN
jgi:hypothetical protein